MQVYRYCTSQFQTVALKKLSIMNIVMANRSVTEENP